MSIEQEVLAAFQIEHREQLQRIRSLLLEMERSSDSSGIRPECVDEAFRMAHSLKGGARICDLHPAERLGHGLETVFSRIREGVLAPNTEIIRGVNQVLNGIEDWMDAVLKTDTPPDPVDAYDALDRLISNDAFATADPAPKEEMTLEQQLRSTFLGEYPNYVGRLRKLFMQGRPGSDEEREDAFRFAHDLRASASAAGEHDAAELAEPLEDLLHRSNRDASIWSEAFCRQALAMLQLIEDRIVQREGAAVPAAVSTSESAQTVTPTGRPIDHGPTDSADLSPPVATAERVVDTVRVRTDSLDRLLRSSEQLLVEANRQDQLTREMHELRRAIESIQRERESLRHAAAAAIQRFGDAPELRRLSAATGSLDARLQRLGETARGLCLRQQQTSWTLQAQSKQIRSDIRQARMVSTQSLCQGFVKMVRDLARAQGKQAELKITGADLRADRSVLQMLRDPLMHMLRNAVTHGIEPPDERIARGKPIVGHVDVSIKASESHLQVIVQDDGRGIDVKRIAEVASHRPASRSRGSIAANEAALKQLIFEPGFSTCASVTELAGRGMGLNVVQESVTRLQGSLALLDKQGAGACISVTVPLAVCAQRLLLVMSGGQTLALPLHAVQRLLRVKPAQIESMDGMSAIAYQRRLIPIVSMCDMLGMGARQAFAANDSIPTIVLGSRTQQTAVIVDALLGEQDAVMQELDSVAARKELAGAAVMPDGAPVLILDPHHLLRNPTRGPHAPPVVRQARQSKPQRPHILVVDDSFTTRTLERSILETHGYDVTVATDGIEALAQLAKQGFAAVISDIEMPRLDGFGLLEQMKKQESTANTPVILVTSRDQPEDQRRGVELGADAYIVKRKFDHQNLLATVAQMIEIPSHN